MEHTQAGQRVLYRFVTGQGTSDSAASVPDRRGQPFDQPAIELVFYEACNLDHRYIT